MNGPVSTRMKKSKSNQKDARNDDCRVIQNPGGYPAPVRVSMCVCHHEGAGIREDIHIKGRRRNRGGIQKVRPIHTEHKRICRKGG
ncbi:hypothetical protein PILCRDRAFT_702440 [Piloderma croceum F 1598]|uniref:Uncharacterized protein n=1 Tax=Piloderma croceum (strain F 1598) TaxID=765440 RepID=A0A0C3EPG7_PILCF|nr:hypothetical protein PILCRDRAFT_702440 [Piloderma croceum F 1598]